MADISVRHTHGLSLDEAKTKTNQIAEDIQSEFDSLIDSIKWNADNTRAQLKGKGFTGVFNVDEEAMSIDIDLKLFAKPFKGKVEQKIQSRIANYFE